MMKSGIKMKIRDDAYKIMVYQVGDDSRSSRKKMQLRENSVNKFDQLTKKRGVK